MANLNIFLLQENSETTPIFTSIMYMLSNNHVYEQNNISIQIHMLLMNF